MRVDVLVKEEQHDEKLTRWDELYQWRSFLSSLLESAEEPVLLLCWLMDQPLPLKMMGTKLNFLLALL